MPKTFLLTTVCAILLIYNSYAQKPCGIDAYYQQLLKDNPPLKARQLAAEKYVQQNSMRQLDETPDTLAVVFHILWNEPYQKISDEVVKIQLARLNEDYNNENSDLYKVPAAFSSLTGKMNIKFMMARTDPNGAPTNGINFVQTTVHEFDQLTEAMKFTARGGSDAWPADKYLNVWVCNVTDAKGVPINGYSTWPWDNSAIRDGVVIDDLSFSVSPVSLNYGRTLVHEVGHWLGLKHIWGDDEDETDPCAKSDDVDDTPNQSGPSSTERLYEPNYISKSNCSSSEMWMNYMNYVKDVCRYMFTKGQVARAKTYFASNRQSNAAARKWDVPAYNMSNTPIFATNTFTSVCAGTDGYIWAGTDKLGLFRFDGTKWEKATVLDNRNIFQIARGLNGNIWIAQAGYEGNKATGGGTNLITNNSFANHTFYAVSGGLASRFCRSIFVDTTPIAGSSSAEKTWVASVYNSNAKVVNGEVETVLEGGGLSRGLNSSAPFFSNSKTGFNTLPGNTDAISSKTIAGNSTEVWAMDDAVAASSKIVRYSHAFTYNNTFWNNTNTGNVLPAGFLAKAMYFDAKGNKWIGLQSGGVALANADNQWKSIAFSSVFPTGTSINNNAIAGDTAGHVFIGTTNGLVFYNGGDINSSASYQLFNTSNGLPGNNVTAVAVDETYKRLIIGTNNGIIIWGTDCMKADCDKAVVPPPIYTTVKNGNWSDPSVWKDGKIPTCNAVVVIFDDIRINVDAVCGALALGKGTVIAQAGIKMLFGCN